MGSCVPHLKESIKQIVYSKLVYRICGLLAWLCYRCAAAVDKQSFWGMYFFAAKLQITIGFRSGLFAYLGHNSSTQLWMEEIERRVIDATDHLDKDTVKQSQNETVLFTTSFVSRTGGHTRLLQTYLSQIPEARLLISGDAFFAGRQHFLTEQEGILSTLFDNAEGRISFNKASKLLPCMQIELLNKLLSKIRPKAIVLFNEPSDLALLVATLSYIRTNKGVRAFYYHHADDYLPFLGNAFHGHIDLDSNQETKCKDTPNRSLIRISARNRKTAASVIAEPFTVFSFVPMTKLGNRKVGEEGYVDLVSTLSQKGVRFVIATRNGEGGALRDLLERSHTDMAGVTVDEQCFDISKYAGLVHAYLDTFPVGGGMSVVDALSMGIPVMINAQHGNQVFRDIALKEFMFAGSAEIMDFAMRLQMDDDFYRQQSQRAHQIFLEFYDESAMVDTLKSLIERKTSRRDIATAVEDASSL